MKNLALAVAVLAFFTSCQTMADVISSKEKGGGVAVTVVTKRRSALGLITTLTEDGFHTSFARGVRFVKNGEPLPAANPASAAKPAPPPKHKPATFPKKATSRDNAQ